MSFKTEKMKLTEIQPHPKNYRKHPEDQLLHIIQSIKEHGFYRNVVISKDNYILAGHGVVQAVKKMGKKEIPVIKLQVNHDSPKALKVLTGDNEIAHLGEIDDRALTELLKEINDMDESGLFGTGFDESMLANLVFVSRPKSEIKDFDKASEWVGLPEYDMQDPRHHSIIVHFESEKDFQDFIKLTQAQVTENSKYMWYPYKPKDDVKSVEFEEEN